MARILAMDWDESEIRFVLGNIHRGKLQILDTGAATVAVNADDEGELRPDLVGTIRSELAAHSIGRTQALVALGRRSVEIMHFELPPSTDDELPELVKNQAIRDSSTVEDRTPVDFITTDDEIVGEPRKVTAVALAEDRLKRIRETCSKGGLKPLRMPLRGYSAASLFLRSPHRTDETSLLLNVVGDELDLTILARGKPVYARSVRLPDEVDDAALVDRIVAELNRTLAVATQDSWSAGVIERVFLFAGPAEHVSLGDRLRDDLQLDVTPIDPFASVSCESSALPPASGRFAPLVGMLLDEADNAAHMIDILHPKRKPKPRSFALPIAAACVAVLVLLSGFWGLKMMEIAALDEEMQELQKEQLELYQQWQQDQQRRNVNASVAAWENAGVNWLDELRDLSIRLSPGEKFVATSVTCSASPQAGVIQVSGRAIDSQVAYSFGQKAKDAYRGVTVGRVLPIADSNYPYEFDAQILSKRRPATAYYAALPPAIRNYQPPQQPQTLPMQQPRQAVASQTPSPSDRVNAQAMQRPPTPSGATNVLQNAAASAADAVSRQGSATVPLPMQQPQPQPTQVQPTPQPQPQPTAPVNTNGAGAAAVTPNGGEASS